MATAKKKPETKAAAKPAAKAPAKRPPPKTSIIKKKAAAQEKRFAKLRQQAVDASTPKMAAIKSPNRHLTEMQMMFVRHWAAGESILSASARAGYSDGGTYAYRLVKDPLIVELYEREKKAYEAACQMTRKKVMDGFLEAAEMAKLQADPTAMVGAWREVGKMCGYYEPAKKTIDININGQVTQKIERLDDDALLAIIKGQVDSNVLDAVFREVTEPAQIGHDG
jgi:hypothetical protein